MMPSKALRPTSRRPRSFAADELEVERVMLVVQACPVLSGTQPALRRECLRGYLSGSTHNTDGLRLRSVRSRFSFAFLRCAMVVLSALVGARSSRINCIHRNMTGNGCPKNFPRLQVTTPLWSDYLGAAVPSDHCPTGMRNIFIGWAAPRNSGVSMTGDPFAKAPQSASAGV